MSDTTQYILIGCAILASPFVVFAFVFVFAKMWAIGSLVGKQRYHEKFNKGESDGDKTG